MYMGTHPYVRNASTWGRNYKKWPQAHSSDQWPLPPSVYLGRQLHHSRHKMDQALPLRFWILQVIKNWTVGIKAWEWGYNASYFHFCNQTSLYSRKFSPGINLSILPIISRGDSLTGKITAFMCVCCIPNIVVKFHQYLFTVTRLSCKHTIKIVYHSLPHPGISEILKGLHYFWVP